MRIAALFVAMSLSFAAVARAEPVASCQFSDGGAASLRKVADYRCELIVVRANGAADIATIDEATHEIEVNGGMDTIAATEALFQELRQRQQQAAQGAPPSCERRSFAAYCPW
jgi:hypothetical protein